jgi:hypothetical protein
MVSQAAVSLKRHLKVREDCPDLVLVYDAVTETVHQFADATSICIIKLLNRPCTVQAIVDKICKNFSDAPERGVVESDVRSFLAKLEAKGLLEATEQR